MNDVFRGAPVALAALLAASVLLPRTASAQFMTEYGDSAHWAMYNRYLEFGPELQRAGRIGEIHWLDDGYRFWYVSEEAGRDVVLLVDPEADAVEHLLDVDSVREALLAAGLEEVPGSGLPFETLELHDSDGKARLESQRATVDIDIGTLAIAIVERREAGPSRPSGVESPDGSMIAFFRDDNVWVHHTADGSEHQLTTDGDPFVRYSLDYNWRSPGTQWSPDSRYLVLVRTDRSRLPRTPVVDWLEYNPEVRYEAEYQEYANAEQHLLHWDAKTGTMEPFDLEFSESDPQWTAFFGWRSGTSELFVARHSPAPRQNDLFAVDPSAGHVRNVLVETDEVRVTPDFNFTFVDGGFLWSTDLGEYRQFFRYDFDGSELGTLTPDHIWADAVAAVDADRDWVYFHANADPSRPYDYHVFRVHMDGSGYEILTEAEGAHDVTISPDARFFVDAHSAPTRPRRTDLFRTNGTFIRTLVETDVAYWRGILGDYHVEEFTARAADGETDLWGSIALPYDFDPSKKYPVLNFVYTTFWPSYAPGFHWSEPRAQLGFVTIRIALRGEGQVRDRAFRTALQGRVGCCEHDDAAAVIQELASTRPWMDLERVGVMGGSWGGYHAARYMLMRPDVFKVGIAERARMHIWGDNLVAFMGTPEENPQGYAESSNIPLADRLEGKLLLVINATDWMLPHTSVYRMIDALIEAGKPYDLILVPGVGHIHARSGERGARADRYVWDQMMPAYLVEHLIGKVEDR